MPEKILSHRQAVGGMWEEIGSLQFEFMKSRGLLPQHKFLDIGCGSLRGGVYFIPYLSAGNYFGIDRDYDLVMAGIKKELPNYTNKTVSDNILISGDFDFEYFDTKFDYALAQSVFTHLCSIDITRCLVNIDKVLKIGGRFYATFFEGPLGNSKKQSSGIITFPHMDPYHQSIDFYMSILERGKLNLNIKRISWEHPRGQLMLEFTKI